MGGPKVSSIRLFPEGNHEIADKTLRRRVGDSAGISRIRQGILEIKKTYRDRGFLQARLGQPVIEVVERAGAAWPVPVTPKPSNYRAKVKLSIFEGPRFRYRKVQLPSLYSDLPLQLPAAGDYYSETELADFRETLLKHFRTNGSFLADFRVREQLDPTTRSVDLTVAFRVLPALSVGTIEFAGYSVFPDSFYRRELHLGEAEPLDPQKLEQSLEALRRTGALSSIRRDDVQITVHAREGEADLLIHLNEKDRLPTPRLILAWNPLRLDRRVLTPKGLARLRDPAFTFRHGQHPRSPPSGASHIQTPFPTSNGIRFQFVTNELNSSSSAFRSRRLALRMAWLPKRSAMRSTLSSRLRFLVSKSPNSVA